MAVSRSASSPPSPAEASPERLTPRSKIKALLDTVPSSDEEGDGRAPSIKSTPKGPAKSAPRTTSLQLDECESDEDDEGLRPRGNPASRMQRAQPLSKEPENIASGDGRIGEAFGGSALSYNNAHSPGRRRASWNAADTESRAEDEADDDDDDDDDDELPVLPRRTKKRFLGQSPGANAVSPTRSPSPGLFVSSPAGYSRTADKDTHAASEDELPAIRSARFQALVERKRAERLARGNDKEVDETTIRVEEKPTSELDRILSEDASDSGITDDEGGHKLTQEARPTRKASRKAIEEIDRETQRMTRNMQLTHEPRTRKKITKESLLERYNFRLVPKANAEPEAHSSSRPTTPPTDVDLNGSNTPPSSPPVQEKLSSKEPCDARRDELPTLVEIFDGVKSSVKGKGKANATVSDVQDSSEPKKAKPRLRVRWPPLSEMIQKSKGSQELEITVTAKDKLDAALNNNAGAQGQESRSLKTLRLLAQVKSPRKSKRGKDDHSNMNAAQLEDWLRQKVRQQAKLEHDRRIEVKKARGIEVLTAEERERQEEDVENLVAKAREEARDIMMEERAAAKNEQNSDDAVDPLAWDESSEDGEYNGAGSQADGEEDPLELSGSEDEVEEELETDDQSGDGDDEQESGEEAEEDEAEQEEKEEGCAPEEDANLSTPLRENGQRTAHGTPEGDLQDGSDEDEAELPAAKQRRERKHTTILSDDEAEVEVTPKPVRTASQSTPTAPTSVLRSATKSFIPGLPVKGPAGLSLTQIFAGTMDDSQDRGAGDISQPLLPDLDQLPDSNFSATAEDIAEDLVQQTQSDIATQATEGVQLDLSQSQLHRLDSLIPDIYGTQTSEMVEPTQDCGPRDYTPMKERFIDPPASTVETVKLDERSESIVQDSPIVRRGRLRRKMEMLTTEDGSQQEVSSRTAFDQLVQGGRALGMREPKEAFDRKKTKAREVVEEQAQESEDEYAGLGGADGEDSDDESTASMRELIDDDAKNNVDERQLAAFHAHRERAADEKEVERLFKDVTTGALRRSRASGFDLSDSDDGGEARRRAKRRKFVKMQKSLYSDERVKRMAEDPGNQAFLRTIEDRPSDDELDILDLTSSSSLRPADSDAAPTRTQTVPDSQPAARFPPVAPAGPRAPAHTRRTMAGKKPSNLSEIRETLSSLLDDRRGSIIPATEAGSDDDEDGGEAAPPPPPPLPQASSLPPQPPADLPRRNSAPIDRISLKRKAASSADPSLLKNARLAFARPSAASSSSSSTSFQAPTLLRRATTNSTLHGAGAGASFPPSTTTDEPGKIKKPAGRSSAVVGMATRSVGPAPLAESERRRERRKWLGAQRRVGAVGALLGKGSFT